MAVSELSSGSNAEWSLVLKPNIQLKIATPVLFSFDLAVANHLNNV
jgi:hypothetical protein